MKKYIILTAMAIVYCLSCSLYAQNKPGSPAYKFDKNGISKTVLENYLEKSITMVYFLSPDIPEAKRIYPYADDDVRMVKNIGAKFLGRAIYRWGGESRLNDAEFLNTASKRIKMMHEYDPDMVFQACLFEIITTDVEKVPVPEWVFRDFGLPVENRTFSYKDMLNDNGKMVNHWRENSSVPDISKLESKLWFYFLAGTYINIGCEAFHIGQVELIGMNDPDRSHWTSIIAKMRDYAAKHARRSWVIIDAHVPFGGLVKDGVSLLDFNSFPLRIKDIPEQPYRGKLEVNYLDGIYLKSKGCITPSGWKCEHLPYLVEFDNFGKGSENNVPTLNSPFIWGWDEISWLSLQPEDYRNEFIRYAYHWLKETDPDGHLEMPGCRMITCPNESSGSYRANTRSDACPIGYSQEETIKALWNKTPIRIGIDGLSHDHIQGLLRDMAKRTDIQLVGIAESDKELVERLAKQFGFDRSIVYDNLTEMVEKTKPQGVLAFNSIYAHLNTVEVCAPRGIHVMVEKPLAVNPKHAQRMKQLATANKIHLLTNYETSWYPTHYKAFEIAVEQASIGHVNKVLVNDGHKGPVEIGCSKEFLAWLTDPVLNGGGAVVDFGCYGANLMTWLMKNQRPLSVTAVLQTIKPNVYPKVDDQATIILTYPDVQAILQGSWNWPVDRKDMEIYGQDGYVKAFNASDLEFRPNRNKPIERQKITEFPFETRDPYIYFAKIIQGDIELKPTDLASLENNLIVVDILDAAKQSAKLGKTIRLSGK